MTRKKRKFLQISHLLLHLSIVQLFSFIVLENKDGDMNCFKGGLTWNDLYDTICMIQLI